MALIYGIGLLIDPEARLYKKSPGTASRLCHISHVLMDNRAGLVVDVATVTSRCARFPVWRHCGNASAIG